MTSDTQRLDRSQASLVSAMVQNLKGATLINESDEEIHINFDAKYKRINCGKFFIKMEYLADGTWSIFSHSFPHYLPIEAILENEKCADPNIIIREIHEFVQSFAARKGQVLEAQDKVDTIVTISNSATYDYIKVFFTIGVSEEFLKGIVFQLKYTLLGQLPAKVDVVVPGRVGENLSPETRKHLKTIVKSFRKHAIAKVLLAIAE